MSKWLYIPTQASSAILEMSGTATNIYTTYTDSDNTTNDPVNPASGITKIRMGSIGGMGLRIYFANQTDRDAFETAYPSGDGVLAVEIDGNTATAQSNWAWNNTQNVTYLTVFKSQWSPSTLFDNEPYTLGDSFNVTIT